MTIPPIEPPTGSYASDWEWRTQTAVPPPNGKVSSNTGTWTGVTSLILSAKSHYGADVSAAITSLATGDTIKIEHKSDVNIWSSWTLVAAPVDNTGYYSVPVSAVAEVHGTPQANVLMKVTLTKTATTPPDSQLPPDVPAPEDGLYRVLTAMGGDLVTLQNDADKLILAGFEPVGGLGSYLKGSNVTYFQAFWRQEAVARFISMQPR